MMEEIAEGMFKDCSSLVSINVPDSVLIIGDSAFARCSGLKEVVLQEGLEEIGFYAFLECDGLTEIRVPHTVKINRGVISRKAQS